ncbi:hypothetical protein Rsub_02514 [Raphidocelis subcapitata]|uniref:N-acetylglucosaminylphosphatidylinositol deacetylase n=1 Tax=Raphidocelis subcapitata TaxID=307507 RepID=A0A2V0NW67_9CHLO|nr:hypothetical protein Rsub_02514 [Raphidocelis subcapitata]|eukprot:GBF89810.1 hypothetical protein Rsub_02514 [Raphidocelis subcapitata]
MPPRAPAAAPAAARLLLVTAHPDDEAMFFAPSLAHFAARGREVSLLCLSNGDADGLGRVREKELLAACRLLGIPPERVAVADDPSLRDGLATEWPAPAVAARLEAALRARPCGEAQIRADPGPKPRRKPRRQVLTFDARGVSGHANHIATHRGVRLLLESRGRELGVERAWQLVSHGPPRKFASALEPLLARALAPRGGGGGGGGGALVAAGGSVGRVVAAMRAHASQWVW